MKIIQVVPISKGNILGELTYYTGESLQIGSIIDVPVRARITPALVVNVEDVTENKLAIRKSLNSLKKVTTANERKIFTSHFISACQETAKFYVGSIGQIIENYSPSLAYDSKSNISNQIAVSRLPEMPREDIRVLQSLRDDRVAHYKIYIREQFAKNKSTYIYVPHHADANYLFALLSFGIEKYSFMLHSNLTPRELKSSWEKARSSTHPILVIATSKYLSLPRTDIGTYIIESDARSHKSMKRPYPDARFFIRSLAKHSDASVIIGDTILSLETFKLIDNGTVELMEPLRSRLRNSVDISIIPMRTFDKENKSKDSVTIFSDASIMTIDDAVSNNKKVFLYINRKGLSPTTICGDCGTILNCSNCEVPLLLTTRCGKNEYSCAHCNKHYSATTRCTNCKSWKLRPLGIGIERVKREIDKYFPQIPCFLIDSNTTKTAKQVMNVVDEYYSSTSAILVGTEMAIPYLNQLIDSAVVVSVDSMLSLPDYSISERLYSTLIHISDIVSEKLIIQTRHETNELFSFLPQKNTVEFQKNELRHRLNFGYPPFKTIIKIAIYGNKEKVESVVDKLSDELSNWSPLSMPSFIPHKKGQYSMYILLKINRESWPDENLIRILKSYPSSYIIDVNPLSLL